MDTAISELEKIQIILHEYDSLRSEIVQRWVGAQQQISVGVLVLIGVVTVWFSNPADRPVAHYLIFSGILIAAVCIFCLAMWQFGRDTGKTAARLREIEHEVNRRAGEELLQWENRWGGAVTGYWGVAPPIRPLNLKKE